MPFVRLKAIKMRYLVLSTGATLFGQLHLDSYFMQIRLDLEGLKIFNRLLSFYLLFDTGVRLKQRTRDYAMLVELELIF